MHAGLHSRVGRGHIQPLDHTRSPVNARNRSVWTGPPVFVPRAVCRCCQMQYSITSALVGANVAVGAGVG